MTLKPGQTLAHYRIDRKIGEGGMGEVWAATDTRLNRPAAIKALPAAVAADPERLGRFTREAQLLAALSHPNIAAIFGLEQVGDASYLALELIEGDDLSERIAGRPVAPDEAVEIALQIAAALEQAHEKGIVHRDLKPANIKLAADGKVKVLDFGLAKALTGEPDGSLDSLELSASPTLTAAMGTHAGIILGTAGYMSPEQARGKKVDRRADIYVTAFPDPGGKWQVSSGGGELPVWRADGRELYYISSDHVMAVPVESGEAFRNDTPVALFELPDIVRVDWIDQIYDAAPDGERFLFLMPREDTAPGKGTVTLVQGWRGLVE